MVTVKADVIFGQICLHGESKTRTFRPNITCMVRVKVDVIFSPTCLHGENKDRCYFQPKYLHGESEGI